MSSTTHSAVAILRQFYAEVLPLQDYLKSIFASNARVQLHEEDTDEYRALYEGTYIAVNEKYKGAPLCPSQALTHIRDILQEAQRRLIRAKKTQNILALGYRLDQGDKGGRLHNTFVNTIAGALEGDEWETLLNRIGADAMIHLLSDTSIFVSLPNGCLCQMTGIPVVNLRPTVPAPTAESEPTRQHGEKRALDGGAASTRPTKKLKTYDSVGGSRSGQGQKADDGAVVPPSQINIMRARLFYARPAMAPKSNRIVVGLPPRHILNLLKPTYIRTASVDVDYRAQFTAARKLSKYVLPRQYGLAHPFQHTKGNTQQTPDFSDREAEIEALGPCKTPKRLKEALCLLEKLIWRHGKCRYLPLRDKVCPTKVPQQEGGSQIDSSVILEMMSEHSVIMSQMSVGNTSTDSNGRPIQPLGLTQAERYAQAKPKFTEFECSYEEVYRYASLITRTVIPKGFWGTADNMKLVLRHVKEFISCRRYETFSLHHLLQGFSTSACDWLGPANPKATRVSESDMRKRRELVEDFVFWYFDGFLVPLLKTTFYITESSAFRNRVLYFRQDDWQTLCAPLVDRLTASTFQRLSDPDAKELLRQRRLGFSFVRLLPKETGVRPIVNLRRRTTRQGGERSINQILQAAFQILTYEKKAHLENLGASVFSNTEVYAKLKAFKAALPRSGDGKLPKLYFVKVDVQACFDTIDQQRLLAILREVISEDRYMTQRHGQVHRAAGKIRRTYVKRAIPEDQHPDFIEYARELASAMRCAVFADQVTYPHHKRDEILQLLEEHITENIVKIGHTYYKQTVGIPQGSVLSALLCSFFYGDLEKRRMPDLEEDGGSLLLRLIDDYLLVTTSRARAIAFLDMMHAGHPDYGCFIAREKTLTNFDYDEQVMNVIPSGQRDFPWCGYMIDMKNLTISVDYTRYKDKDIENSLTVDRGRKPGAAFVGKMLLQARARSHPIYCDPALNTAHGVHVNVYQNFVLCAMKMCAYVREYGAGLRGSSGKLVLDTIHKTIAYAYASLRGQLRKTDAGEAWLKKTTVTWLGLHAFSTVLARKPRDYVLVRKALNSELRAARYKRYDRRFRNVVHEGLMGIASIPF